jgi:thiol:disulfide interchange protein DsbA
VRIISIFALILSLAACQQAADDTATSKEVDKKVTASETNKNQSAAEVVEKTKESNEKVESAETKDFSLLTEQPYDIVESDEACTAPVVIEFFAYQCPHCYKLEKFADAWKKKNAGKVQFRSVPTDLGRKEFSSFMIVHHSAEKLGLLDSAIPALFNRLHEQKKAFASLDEAVDFLVSLGASEQDAKKAIEDQEAVKTAIDESFRLLSKYKITGVPAILVNHRYKFDVTKAGGYDKVFEVVEETLKLPSGCSDK